jgi:signal transduction histidine kinase
MRVLSIQSSALQPSVDLRIESGFDLVQIMAEYRVLRACVLRLWREGDPDGFAQGADDITRFSEAVDQALTAIVPIYEKQEANYRDRFLGMLGHDLRNPLNSILMGATSLARSEGLTDKQRETVSRMITSVRRPDLMVNDILDFARGRLGSPMPITLMPANLGTLVREVADEVRSTTPGLSVDCRVWHAGRIRTRPNTWYSQARSFFNTNLRCEPIP